MKLKLFVLGTMLCASVGLQAMQEEGEEVTPDGYAVVDVMTNGETKLAKVRFSYTDLNNIQQKVNLDAEVSNNKLVIINEEDYKGIGEIALLSHLKRKGKESHSFGMYGIYMAGEFPFVVVIEPPELKN